MNMHVETAKKRVFVVDDHPIVRSGLALLINREPDLVVCGDAEEMPAALEAIGVLRPDILVIDLSLNGPDGLDLVKRVREREPILPVLILSIHDECIYAERALRAGANGYIMKQEATDRVLTALRRILNREIYVSDRIANKMLQRVAAGLTIRPRTRSIAADRRWAGNETDGGTIALKHQDRRVISESS